MNPEDRSSVLNQQAEVDDVVSDSTDYDEIDTVEKWHGIVRAIESTTQEAFKASPSPKDASAPDFQRYWREVFNQLSNSISSDSNIPKFLTSPPTRKFQVFLFHVGEKGCPCCLPETDPNIVLENEGGVTKDDFMRGFIDYMYGESLPKINDESGSEVRDGTCAVVYGSNWMSQGKNKDGEKIALIQMVAPEDRVPDIWLYCSDPTSYLEKVTVM